MVAAAVFMTIVVLAAVAVAAVVLLGIEGRGTRRAPQRVTLGLRRAADHLQGDAPVPAAFEKQFEKILR